MKNTLTNLARAAVLIALSTILTGCLDLSMINPYVYGPTPAARTTHQVVRPARGPWVGTQSTRQERLAWRLLDERCYRESAGAFAREISCSPGAARPYVGMALATAMNGDLCGGSSAMRAALRLDPDVLDTVDVTPRLGRVLGTLIDEYGYDMRIGAPVAETALTLSALHYLRGDLIRADAALTLCRRSGGRTALTDRFGAVIDDRRSPIPEPEEPITRLSRATPPRAPAPAPKPTLVPAPAPGPVPDPEPTLALEPEPEPTREPVDYDKLRAGIQDASDTLDRFTGKLLEQIASADTD